MAYDTNVSFHGVSRIEIGAIKSFTRGLGDGTHSWQTLTLWLFDAEGRLAASVPVHSDDERTLAVSFECKTEIA